MIIHAYIHIISICFQMRGCSELQFGTLREVWRHARGREHCPGKPGSALSGGYDQIRPKQRVGRSWTSQGRAEFLCARIEGANREDSEGKVDLRPLSVSFLRGPTRRGERTRLVRLFQGCTGHWTDGGSCAGFTSSRPSPPWTLVFRFSGFLYGLWP